MFYFDAFTNPCEYFVNTDKRSGVKLLRQPFSITAKRINGNETSEITVNCQIFIAKSSELSPTQDGFRNQNYPQEKGYFLLTAIFTVIVLVSPSSMWYHKIFDTVSMVNKTRKRKSLLFEKIRKGC